jgi:glucose/mannose-6-phosphate isomerase
LEGLANPKKNKEDLIFVFFSSNFDHPRVQKRLKLTMEIVKKSHIRAVEYKLTGPTKLIQAFELLQFGSWVTFYLAMLNKINPSLIPSVDWFKKKLG